MKRGDLVTVALAGDQGKPRPALVIQADAFEHLGSVSLLPITSAIQDAPLLRVTVQPDAGHGLQQVSQVMIDKVQTPSQTRVGRVFGRLHATTMTDVDRSLALFLGLG